jgi:hypothetical protein
MYITHLRLASMELFMLNFAFLFLPGLWGTQGPLFITFSYIGLTGVAFYFSYYIDNSH